MTPTEPSEIDPAIDAAARDFAMKIMDTLGNVLPAGAPVAFGISAKRTRYNGVVAVVSQNDDLGIPLNVSGNEVLRLVATFECRASPISTFLTVEDSTFKVYVTGSNGPLFTVDYRRSSHGGVPAAHLNVHAKRDDMTKALLASGGRSRGKGKQRMIAQGKSPRLGQLHFPLGGHRFRPCLEDVLEMLIVEFGIDRTNDAMKHLAAGRRTWRKIQLSAAVSDDPLTAATELKRLGYEFAVEPTNLTEREDRTSQI